MILIDPRKGGEKKTNTPQELVTKINALKVPCELHRLEYADIAFEGRGPDGSLLVGIERKTLHDLLTCIDDNRLSGHQLVGMRQMYGVRAVLVEGHWRAHEDGWLMEGFQGGTAWGYCKPFGRRVLYSKVARYLISLQLAGVPVIHSRDLQQTAINVVEWYHYFQKPWHQHTSMQGMQMALLPSLTGKPSLARRWAAELPGVDHVLSERMARTFPAPIQLAVAEEDDLMTVPGIGKEKAAKIIAAIWGRLR